MSNAVHADHVVHPDHAAVPYRARFDECGADASIRASTLLRWAQDAAWIHSERLGFGREWYFDRGLAWVVRGLDLEMLAPIRMGTSSEVETRVTGFRRVMARRRTEVRLSDGTIAATVTTDWVMTDMHRLMPTRVPATFPALFGSTFEGFEPTKVDARDVPAGASPLLVTVRPHELDPMEHANNAVYVDWLEEAVRGAGGAHALDQRPRRYRLEYFQAAGPGQLLEGQAWPADDDAWRYRLHDHEDRDVLRAELTIGPG